MCSTVFNHHCQTSNKEIFLGGSESRETRLRSSRFQTFAEGASIDRYHRCTQDTAPISKTEDTPIAPFAHIHTLGFGPRNNEVPMLRLYHYHHRNTKANHQGPMTTIRSNCTTLSPMLAAAAAVVANQNMIKEIVRLVESVRSELLYHHHHPRRHHQSRSHRSTGREYEMHLARPCHDLAVSMMTTTRRRPPKLPNLSTFQYPSNTTKAVNYFLVVVIHSSLHGHCCCCCETILMVPHLKKVRQIAEGRSSTWGRRDTCAGCTVTRTTAIVSRAVAADGQR